MAPYNEEAANNFLNPANERRPAKVEDRNDDVFPEYANKGQAMPSKLDLEEM